MKRRIFALALAGALALSLTACGGGNNGGVSSSDPGSASSSQMGGDSSSGTLSGSASGGASSADGLAPDGSQPDGSGASSSGDTSAPAASITLNKTSVTLNKAGATFNLRFSASPDTGDSVTYTSSNTKVATVSKTSGTITAVAPGSAVITAEYSGATATCSVTCNWTEEKPAEPAKPDASQPAPEPEKPADPAPASVDLQKFFGDTTSKYEFGMLELADDTLVDQFYAGMSSVSAEQKLVYVCPMSMNNGEFGLVQVKDSKDVDTVKAIFQARIDYMAGDGNEGGAFYPGAIEQWAQNARVVSNGSYVMMVVHENCNDIVNDFNALF